MNFSGVFPKTKSGHEILMEMMDKISEKNRYYSDLEKLAVIEGRRDTSFKEALHKKGIKQSVLTEDGQSVNIL